MHGGRDANMATGRGTVVVIEDDEGMREAIESLLDAAGFATTTYASAEALLAANTSSHARCIVSDVKLPAMSGLELLIELRGRGAGPPVILVTAHDSPAMRSEALRSGAAAYLSKPFAGSALIDAVERASQ